MMRTRIQSANPLRSTPAGSHQTTSGFMSSDQRVRGAVKPRLAQAQGGTNVKVMGSKRPTVREDRSSQNLNSKSRQTYLIEVEDGLLEGGQACLDVWALIVHYLWM